GKEDHLAIRSRYGKHSVASRDMEDYIDFFDYVFGRTTHKPENRLFYPYSFEDWRQRSGEQINPKDFPAKGLADLTKDASNTAITSVAQWETKRSAILNHVRWGLGEEPPGVINPGPRVFNKNQRVDEHNVGSFLDRPRATAALGRLPVSPHDGVGDQL